MRQRSSYELPPSGICERSDDARCIMVVQDPARILRFRPGRNRRIVAVPPRSIWTGVITFGMVPIPVRLLPATQDKDISFHLLHKPDHSRIKFKRWCAAEDVEVDTDELVKAFEVSKDQYVEITDEDLQQLPLPARHTIELSAFVDSAEIDPIYYEKSYYLEPEETGVKPYALLLKVLEKKGVTGVASIEAARKRQGGAGARESAERESGERERPAPKARKTSRGRKKAA